MAWQFSPFGIILSATFLFAASVAWLIWQRRDSPGGRTFVAMSLASALWVLCDMGEQFTTAASVNIVLSKIGYLGIVTVPLLGLFFALDYTQIGRLNKLQRFALWIIPFLTFCLVLTNEWHHLIWSHIKPMAVTYTRHQLIIFKYEHGTAFWFYYSYAYLLNTVSTLILLASILRLPQRYQGQAVTLLISLFIPWGANLYYVTGYAVPGVDITPIALVISSSAWAWAILRQKLLDVVPMARHMLVERMSDGVLVLDRQNRIIDKNRASDTLLPVPSAIGTAAETIFPQWETIAANAAEEHCREIPNDGDDPRWLSLRLLPLTDAHGSSLGRLLILRDVTERQTNEIALREANLRLREQVEEIELLQTRLRQMALRDPLTDLPNRRALEHTLHQKLQQAQREPTDIAVALIDLDHFKSINDRYGHAGGDHALTAFAILMRSLLENGETIFRYGGEEFVAIFPGCTTEAARRRVERWRAVCQHTEIRHRENVIRLTFSAGIASYPEFIDAYTLLDAADNALYRAKDQGRNSVLIPDTVDLRRRDGAVFATAPGNNST